MTGRCPGAAPTGGEPARGGIEARALEETAGLGLSRGQAPGDALVQHGGDDLAVHGTFALGGDARGGPEPEGEEKKEGHGSSLPQRQATPAAEPGSVPPRRLGYGVPPSV